jgi:hypothetical protein
MKKTKEEKHEIKQIYQTSIICDLCKKESEQADHWVRQMPERAVITTDENSITLTHKFGKRYPEGGWGQVLEIDICPECLQNKVLPFLKEQGCSVEYQDWET